MRSKVIVCVCQSCNSVKWAKIDMAYIVVQFQTVLAETKTWFNNGTRSSSEQKHGQIETNVSREEHKAIQISLSH